MVEVPSLIMLALSSWCQRLSPEDRPKMYKTLKGIFDKNHYDEIFRVFDEMDYCLHCDGYVTPFIRQIQTVNPSTDSYHLLVAHPTLREKENCDCYLCREIQTHWKTPRLCLCVRCKASDHLSYFCYRGIHGITPLPANQWPFHLLGARYSGYQDHVFTLTNRAPSAIVEWARAMSINNYGYLSEKRKRDYPVRGGHSICNRCVVDMLSTGQLRWDDQKDTARHFFNPGYCEGCHRSDRVVQTIVVQRRDSVFRFGRDHIVYHGTEDYAFYRYQCYDRSMDTTVYVPKCSDDSIAKYLDHGVLICNDCFKRIQPNLEKIYELTQ